MHDTDFPPRGSAAAGCPEAPPSQIWGHPWELGPGWDWTPGMVMLGRWERRVLGRDDDRHVVTVAGSRAGKSTTVLIPNLLHYPGSVVVLDPKGELARATAAARARMGQRVFVLDPFGETGIASASHNPFSELGMGRSEHVAADAAQLADALIINNAKDPHWTDSAKNLTRGITLHLMDREPQAAGLRELRRCLHYVPAELDRLFASMAESAAFDGVVANIGAAFLGKSEAGGRELQSILSTAQEQTAPLDDILGITAQSDFRLSDLRSGRMSLYLVLPGMRMGTHYRWLRLVIQQALNAMERAPVPRGHLPVLFVLEEFPALGHMRSIETAAGLMAGFGVKLWSVLQDLTQLKRHYRDSWETFLGNAGTIQAFANMDETTTKYLSSLLGQTTIIEEHAHFVTAAQRAQGDFGTRQNIRSVPLLAPAEITMHFARETSRQLVLVPGERPAYFERLPIPRGDA